MGRNRSNSKPGHRPGRRAGRNHGNKSGITKTLQGNIPSTNLINAALNASSSAVVDLTFDLPVIVGDPASPGLTDINLTGSTATTRHGTSTTQTRSNFVSVACSGALTRSKTYTADIAADQGLIQPANGRWGTRSKSFAT